MTFFHGAVKQRHVWDYNTLGRGADQHGPGWYFTTDYKDAAHYAQPNGVIHRCRLLCDNDTYCNIAPRDLDDWQDTYSEKLVRLIHAAPDLKQSLEDWDENPGQALAAALTALFKQASPYHAIQQVWYDFYLGREAVWAKQVPKIFGWDCAWPPVEETHFQHVVVWNPEIIVVEQVIPYEVKDV